MSTYPSYDQEMLRPLVDRTAQLLFRDVERIANPPYVVSSDGTYRPLALTPGGITFLPPGFTVSTEREVEQLRMEVGQSRAATNQLQNGWRFAVPLVPPSDRPQEILARPSAFDCIRRILRVEKIKAALWESRSFQHLYRKLHRQINGQESRERGPVSAIGWGQAQLRGRVQEPDPLVTAGPSGEHELRFSGHGSVNGQIRRFTEVSGQVLVNDPIGWESGSTATVGTAGVQIVPELSSPTFTYLRAGEIVNGSAN